MKQTIGCGLCLVLSMGSTVVLAENTLSDYETTDQSVVETKVESDIDKNSNKALSHKTNTDISIAENPLNVSSSVDGKRTKPLPGDFTVMSQPDVGTGVIQVTFGLFVVLLIIAAAAWFTRRFGHFQGTAGGAVRIVGGLHLGTRERLVVVQVGEEQLLLGVAPGRVSTLHVLSKPLHQDESVSSRNPHNSGAFLDKLNAVLKKGR
ncbi:flagellar biosynthetic protein FliO [Kaarinaea lacus]